jgi:hypothetical protein
MLTATDRERFATDVIEEVRRWPGVELRQHASSTEPDNTDGIEFRLFGKQIGHVHGDCSVHLALTKALKESLIAEHLAEPLAFAATSGWAMFAPMTADDAQRAIWLLRLNYVRFRRQRLTPNAAASSPLLQQHEALLRAVSPAVVRLLQRTQARSKPRPIPALASDLPTHGSAASAPPPS